jgi:hypothetical protein
VKLLKSTGCWWLTHAILATWEVKIERIRVQSHPLLKKVLKTPSQWSLKKSEYSGAPVIPTMVGSLK